MRFLVLTTCLLFFPFMVQAQEGRPATKVFAARVQMSDFADTVEALGTLKANESTVLTAKTTETIKVIDFTDGQSVKKGDILAMMTNDEESALLAEAKSTMDEAKLQLERTIPLVRQGAASQSVLDQRQREFDTAAARVRALEARMEQRLIIAPFDGVLGLRNISVGALVQPGTPITTLVDLSKMKLDFNVPSVFLPTLAEGLDIIATAAAFGDREFKGQVTSIDSQIDENTRSITVRAVIPNDDMVLKPGLLMSVRLYKDPRRTILIPEESLLVQGRKKFVYVIHDQDGKTIARRTEVETGSRRVGVVEILSGLSEGDIIVTDGTMKITDGAAVNAIIVEKTGQNLQQKLNADQSTEDKQ